jgi:sugar lactone lactonase YvrE
VSCSSTLAPPAHATSPALPPPAATTTPAARPNGPQRPAGWNAPEVLVAPSSFHGVHGLAIDKQGRLLAGTVVGGQIWEVDRTTGAAKIFIDGPDGEADDIAIGPKGEMAWTGFTQGVVRYRENDAAPIRVLATGLPGANSIAFNQKTGKLYMSQVFMGDALWELDVAGKAAPRLIAKGLGGFNGFEVGPDGELYGPLWFKGQVVKINPANAKLTVINADFKTPAAANLDGKGNLWVLDTKAGTLNKVTLADGKKTEVAKLATALDNLVIAPDGMIFISNMADNSIQSFDPATSAVKTLTSGKLAAPAGLQLDGDKLLVVDVFSFRSVDTKTGEVKDIYRVHDSKLEYPEAIALGAKQIALIASSGSVQLLDRASKDFVDEVHGWKSPTDALPLDDGSLLVLENATNSLIRASGDKHAERTTVVKDLEGPTQMILGADGMLYVTEASGGRLTKINLRDGSKSVVSQDLATPEGLTQTAWGTFLVAETGKQRIVEIDPGNNGERRTVADKLPIGLRSHRADVAPAYLATGVAVSGDGTVFVSCDVDNSLLRIKPKT